jgi:hypothetical protein
LSFERGENQARLRSSGKTFQEESKRIGPEAGPCVPEEQQGGQHGRVGTEENIRTEVAVSSMRAFGHFL